MFNLIQNVIKKKENKILVMKTVTFVYLIWLAFHQEESIDSTFSQQPQNPKKDDYPDTEDVRLCHDAHDEIMRRKIALIYISQFKKAVFKWRREG